MDSTESTLLLITGVSLGVSAVAFGARYLIIKNKPLPAPPPPVEIIYECRYCHHKTKEHSYYCERCFKDPNGFTQIENYHRFNVPNQYGATYN